MSNEEQHHSIDELKAALTAQEAFAPDGDVAATARESLARRRSGWRGRPGGAWLTAACVTAVAVLAGVLVLGNRTGAPAEAHGPQLELILMDPTLVTVPVKATGTVDGTRSLDPPTLTLPAGQAQALRSDLARGTAASDAVAGASMTGFGADLLNELLKADPTAANTVISPYSIYSVLAMARQGAKGETGTQIDEALGADAELQQQVMTAVDQAVASAIEDALAAEVIYAKEHQNYPDSALKTEPRPIGVDVANSVWSSPDLNVHQEFLDALAAGFNAGMYNIDFAKDPEAARATINQWVADHTGNLIKDLLAEGVITIDTVMVLVNAVHLLAPWLTKFDTALLGVFHAPTGAAQAAMMTQTEPLATSSGSGWESVTVPYQGGKLAMTIVMPDDGAWDQVAGDLTGVLMDATAAKASGMVELTMPTFNISSAPDLKPLARSLGIEDMFTTAVDLSGIAGVPGELVAHQFVHQATIMVDQAGTEAAAATALTIVRASLGPIGTPFVVDRPFFYVIHDTSTGAPLFLGTVTDPTA